MATAATRTPKPRAQRITGFTSLLESGTKRSSALDGGRVFRGVTIIKSGLGNRRDRNYYPPDTLKEAADAGMFEGLKAYADHPTTVDEQIQPERSIRDYVGLYTNTRFNEGGGGRVVGDLRILRAHKWLADVVDELIEVGAADKIGLSINGRGHTVPGKAKLEESGEEVDVNEVRKFIDLRSADVVTEAGAGGGFPQLLESARGAAAKERPMKKSILTQLEEAAKAGDLELVQKLTAKLAEANKGKKVAEADEEDAEDATDGSADEGTEDEGDGEEPVGKKKGKKVAEADEEDDENDDEDGGEDGEEPDHDADLDRAVEAAKGTLTEDDEDDEGGESEDDESLEEAGCGKKKRTMAEAKGPLAKGMPGAGAGNAIKRAGKFPYKGRKFGEADVAAELHALRVENARLSTKLDKVSSRNNRLAEALRIREKADIARKLLKESGIPPEARADFVERLVSLPNAEAMAREIRFHQRLMESAVGRVRAEVEDSFDSVETGTSLRESYAGGGGDEELTDLLVGLPVKK